jgi:APA family basic amino acid/polyamine antiporter
VALSAFGVLNAQLLSGPRLIFGLRGMGGFFAPFGVIHPKFGTPLAAILMLSVLSLVLLFAAGESGLDKLLTGTVFVDGVFFVMTGAALLVLRRREGRAGVAFLAPLHPVFPVLFVVGELGVLIGSYLDAGTRNAAYIGAAWIAAAAVLYLVRFRRGLAPALAQIRRLRRPWIPWESRWARVTCLP